MGENSVPRSGIYSRAYFVPIHCLPVQSHLSSGKGHAVRATVTLAGIHSICLIWLSICQPQIRFACVSTLSDTQAPLAYLPACWTTQLYPRLPPQSLAQPSQSRAGPSDFSAPRAYLGPGLRRESCLRHQIRAGRS